MGNIISIFTYNAIWGEIIHTELLTTCTDILDFMFVNSYVFQYRKEYAILNTLI